MPPCGPAASASKTPPEVRALSSRALLTPALCRRELWLHRFVQVRSPCANDRLCSREVDSRGSPVAAATRRWQHHRRSARGTVLGRWYGRATPVVELPEQRAAHRSGSVVHGLADGLQRLSKVEGTLWQPSHLVRVVSFDCTLLIACELLRFAASRFVDRLWPHVVELLCVDVIVIEYQHVARRHLRAPYRAADRSCLLSARVAVHQGSAAARAHSTWCSIRSRRRCIRSRRVTSGPAWSSATEATTRW